MAQSQDRPDRLDLDGLSRPAVPVRPGQRSVPHALTPASRSPEQHRERYRGAPGLLIPADHENHQLIRLTTSRRFRVVDLRTEANLDALDADDRISTSHEPKVWDACHRLAGPRSEAGGPISMASSIEAGRHPATSSNVAFFSSAGFVIKGDVLRRTSGRARRPRSPSPLHHRLRLLIDARE